MIISKMHRQQKQNRKPSCVSPHTWLLPSLNPISTLLGPLLQFFN